MHTTLFSFLYVKKKKTFDHFSSTLQSYTTENPIDWKKKKCEKFKKLN